MVAMLLGMLWNDGGEHVDKTLLLAKWWLDLSLRRPFHSLHYSRQTFLSTVSHTRDAVCVRLSHRLCCSFINGWQPSPRGERVVLVVSSGAIAVATACFSPMSFADTLLRISSLEKDKKLAIPMSSHEMLARTTKHWNCKNGNATV
jgi:hypothetical protein